MPSIEVQVADRGWQDDIDDPQSMVRRVAGALESHLGTGLDGRDVTIRFSGDGEVRELNARYRGKDGPTNVLSFPAAPMPGSEENPLGDIILARETVLNEAKAQGKSPADHTCHLVLHGLLHLLDYTHENDSDAEEMEQIERAILAQLGIADPYADRALMEAPHGR
jgi:probable rRNA maturation factor